MTTEKTIDEIEAANLHEDDGRVPHVPFGFNNPAWIAFKSKMQPGDKIVELHSDAKSWANLAGRSGYILVRKGETVDEFITRMN